MSHKSLKTIEVPQELFKSMMEAYQKWEKFSNEFEDFLLSFNEKFIKKMRKARKEHLQRKIRDIEILKKELE